ncbi:type I secretion system permease/ATPase [Chelatococcus asaccharovorans]|uniref:ATP-binding cassette subfamily C protein n=1 Tax=Chelatococcus asaccharovorans TaxID=28210 RepID=A0A2V3U3W9_9HYPH|nr:type I secretion system permease/ATPase [Chelatococcus asaccharovorans]MBS7704943.1 type I secretion system permease/ATPase [Chelatococcus asaccharovorans]PXW51857.1 ATP-binding cassette subfamily C protein [Chelatococcus asaccharovorans]CAH1651357.1 Alkaline protease secretion ATP-binding protein AprD [Chelatococcus asaccharovorans]CAH1686631.1 Alkaline protease secretion ATP-binding protein AprD [Chelatococcus asaccharovorans]
MLLSSWLPHHLLGTTASKPTPLEQAIRKARPAIGYVALFTSVTSVLGFVTPIYMMNVYDRVLSSRSVDTLLALSLIAAFLLLIAAVIRFIRTAMLKRLGAWCDEEVAPQLFSAIQTAALTSPNRGEVQALRDLDTFREFWVNHGLVTVFSAMYTPIFLVALFVLSPYLGILALVAVAIIAVLAVLIEKAMWPGLKKASEANIRASTHARMAMRNVESVHAMGMRNAMADAWHEEHRAALAWNAYAAERAAPYTTASTFISAGMMIAVLGAAAFLALEGQISPGAIFAANLIFRQATGPLRSLIQQWKGFLGSRLAYGRLQTLFREAGMQAERVVLPRPEGALSVENATLSIYDSKQIVLRNVDFAIEPGDVLGIIGPSGAGKSTLSRALVGLIRPTLGTIRIDGADLEHWAPDELGRYVGYLPQNVELLAGTVAENVRRFRPRDDAGVIEAAKLVGVHDLIQSLPAGYNTRLGEDGIGLSGGQRQRIALARAAYGRPSYVVLDEPNSNLDAAGEAALTRAILTLKEAGTTVVLVTHKAQILSCVDKIAVLGNGTLMHFGLRDDVLKRLSTPKIVPIKGQQPELLARR